MRMQRIEGQARKLTERTSFDLTGDARLCRAASVEHGLGGNCTESWRCGYGTRNRSRPFSFLKFREVVEPLASRVR